jgi:hypothetical protein
MPPQPFAYLVLTDGTDTVTFEDGTGVATNYQLTTPWAPAIANLRTSPLAGRGPYGDVTEELTCAIVDTTAALCYAKLDTLARLLDKAARWWVRNENISPVVLKYAAPGSTIHSTAAPMQAIVLGRADDSGGALALNPTFNEALQGWIIEGVRMLVSRRGPWIGASESASAAVLTVTLPSTANIPGPLEIDFTGFAVSSGPNQIEIGAGFMCIAPNNAFSLQQGEAANAAGIVGTWAVTADAAARASGGSVGRLSHTAIPQSSYLNWTLPAAFATSTRIGVYLTYRNNSANAWSIRAESYNGDLPTTDTTPLTYLAAAVSNPLALYVGPLAPRYGATSFSLVLARVGGTGTVTIDIDTVLAVDFSSGQTYVLAQAGIPYALLSASFASKSVQIAVSFSPATLRDPEVRADFLTTAYEMPVTVSGDTAICGSGSSIQAVWYATQSTWWTTQNAARTATLNIGATISRRLAYLSPQ